MSGVVGAMQDPNPKVAGSGYEKLRASGIKVEGGLMEAQARALNRGFLSRIERGRPWLRIKLASSLDELATALQTNQPVAVYSDEEEALAQQLEQASEDQDDAHRLLQTQLGLICRQLAPLRSMASHLVRQASPARG